MDSQLSNGTQMEPLAQIGQAQAALEKTTDFYEMRSLGNIAAAAALFAEREGLFELAQTAKILQLKADRKMGEWLRDNVDHNGGNPNLFDLRGLPEGVTKRQSYFLQIEASVSEERFLAWLDDCITSGKEITASALRGVARNRPKSLPPFESLRDVIVDRVLLVTKHYPERIGDLLTAIRDAVGGQWR